MSATTKFYDNYIKAITDLSLQEVAEHFKKAKNYPHNIKMFPNHQDRFIDWLQGLPSGLNHAFSNYDILQLGVESGYLSKDKIEPKKEAIVIKNYYPCLSMAFIRAFNKAKIEWY